ncbi:MAG: MBL fold metallo-hydrolase [Chloroflexi bacterium]|nr:MBL fold metallo-hydrolase [Chloroflexota bacterium]MCI0579914.1 MBL fold metallo-hydrolase [Chloroflexota bacterium]MCI0646497.1 MBL fold metallo-hydrolase [Chloroflexota bacterium]MCI0726151.1 MBL fold metallo-hydrolase [Chloroflexota bacterium]
MTSPEPAAAHLSVADFYSLIQQENSRVLLLDVRNDQEFNAWRIESRFTPETLHIPYVIFVEEEEAALDQIPAGREIIAVCARGRASDFVAGILRQNGFAALNLAGGMAAWGSYYVFRPVVQESEYQIYQVDRVARGCLSYVLISQGQAAVVDPLRHVAQYTQFLAGHGAALTLVLDSHAHADHISGGPALARAGGAPYYLHPYDAIHPFDLLPAAVEYQPLQDGQQFTVGHLTIHVLHLPGHTLGQVNFLVTEPRQRSYVFTGDAVFLEGFGRPDLGGRGESWLTLAYESIFNKFKATVPADNWILPGHYASFDEASDGGLYLKKAAELWRDNSWLQFSDRDSFVEYTLAHLADIPPQCVEIKRVNTGLLAVDEHQAGELELGRNLCAVS